MKRKRLFGWHFSSATLRDGSPLPKVGHWERYSGPLKMCVSGLHVGITPWDALQYAPGDTLRMVEYAEVGEQQSDKIVCARRRTIAQMDATEMLRYFARLQAISCLDRWKSDPPDVVMDYLATGNEEVRAAALAAALAAARAAARDAARDAAWAAALAAALAAARSAARDAARDVALAAARAAARDAARDAAWAAALAAALAAARAAALAAARAAALAAALAAARAAARDAAWDEFNALVYECFEGPMRDVGFQP